MPANPSFEESSPLGSDDKVIDTDQDAIVQLSLYGNHFPPIARLSPEILSEIFAMCVAAYVTVDQFRFWHPRYWFAFSHVCQYWRILALSYPMLWSFINFAIVDSNWISELLSRSKNVPLSIAVQPGKMGSTTPEDKQRILRTLLAKDMSRVYELYFTFDDDRKVVGSARMLRTLNLWNINGSRIDPSPFTGIFYHNQAPLLEHLILHLIPYTWQPTVYYPHLKEFHLWSNAAWDNFPIGTFTDILTVVERMPLLEILHLQDCLPNDAKPPARTLVKPFLRDITLRGKLDSCLKFLSYMDCPSMKKIRISSNFNDGHMDWPLARISYPSGLRYAFLGPICNDGSTFFRLYDHSQPGVKDFSPRISVKGTDKCDFPETSPDWVYRLCGEILSFSDVETLTLYEAEDLLDAGFAKLLSQMRRLRVIRVYRCSCTCLLSILLLQYSFEDENNDYSLSFPSELELEFYRTQFSRDDLYDLSNDMKQCRQNSEDLTGVRIKRIVYGQGCDGLDADVINLLEEITGAAESEILDDPTGKLTPIHNPVSYWTRSM